MNVIIPFMLRGREPNLDVDLKRVQRTETCLRNLYTIAGPLALKSPASIGTEFAPNQSSSTRA